MVVMDDTQKRRQSIDSNYVAFFVRLLSWLGRIYPPTVLTVVNVTTRFPSAARTRTGILLPHGWMPCPVVMMYVVVLPHILASWVLWYNCESSLFWGRTMFHLHLSSQRFAL